MVKFTLCDLLAPPDILKKYVTKNKEELNKNNESEWAPYIFDFNKVVKPKNTLTKRTVIESWNMKNWGTKDNASHSGYIPGSDSVSFWCKDKCPDIVIKKIFDENPGVEIRFYWFNEKDPIEHHYIRKPNGKIDIKRGQGLLTK